MRQIIPRLFVAAMDGCAAEGLAICHCCKSPCHVGKCGKTTQGHPHYHAYREDRHIFLNMVDSPSPKYTSKPLIDAFLKWFRDSWIKGESIVLHCNEGRSRSPSLALLALAKILGAITNESYDAAWDAFERLTGQPYEPTAGIEEWLRTRWHDVACDFIVAPKPVEKKVEAAAQLTDEERMNEFRALPVEVKLELSRNHPLIHFSMMAEIEFDDKSWGTPTPNILQKRMAEAYEWAIANMQKCRIMVLKPRKSGASTFSAELCYHHARRFRSNMMLMGDNAERTKDVFKIFCGIPSHDQMPWDSTWYNDTEKGSLTYEDKEKGWVQLGSAGAERVGIGGTRNIVWMTEAARYNKTGVKTDKDVVMALLNSVAQENPRVLIIAESTAEGSAGWFFENWGEAVTLEERAKGRIGNTWIKIFAAWHEFPEHRLPRNSQTEDFFAKSPTELDEREKRGVKLYRWSYNQIAWRRMKIKMDCSGDERQFDQDFPESPEVAFLSSGRPRFNIEGVTRLELMARANHEKAQRGVLEGRDSVVGFMPRTDEEAWVWVDEEPVYGLSYLLAVDPMRGEQAEGSPVADAHAVGVLRAGYFDARRQWQAPKLVATIDVPGGCRWETELLAERAALLARWYGNCLVIPEMNADGGIARLLAKFDCNIWQREKIDAMFQGQTVDVAGFETNKKTRPSIISALADAIREQNQGLDCNYLPAVLEMKTFVLDDKGKAAAPRGKHDDWVLMLAIAIFHLEFATVNSPPRMMDFRPEQRGVGVGGLSGKAFS